LRERERERMGQRSFLSTKKRRPLAFEENCCIKCYAVVQ
jgi:hypothetical protein